FRGETKSELAAELAESAKTAMDSAFSANSGGRLQVSRVSDGYSCYCSRALCSGCGAEPRAGLPTVPSSTGHSNSTEQTSKRLDREDAPSNRYATRTFRGLDASNPRPTHNPGLDRPEPRTPAAPVVR